jgi:PAS domain-containing protein
LSSDWYWEQDENGHFTKVYGPVQEMLGIPFNSFLHGETGEAQGVRWNESEHATLEANIAARRPFLDFVYSRINADGAHQYFQASGEPMFDASGRFTGYRGVGRDVTEMMRDVAQPHAA